MNRSSKLLVFDLDGTLIDSSKTIYKATKYAFNKLKIENSLTQDTLDRYIGAHFEDIFRELGIIVPDFNLFLTTFLEHYFDFIKDSSVYPNVEQTLYKLKLDYKIALLTTKAQFQAERVVSAFDLTKYFDLIVGRRDGIPVKPSPEPYLYICETLGIVPDDSYMIGDSEFDILCGHNSGANTIAVTYGYRDISFLKSHSPDYLVSSIDEILTIFNGKAK